MPAVSPDQPVGSVEEAIDTSDLAIAEAFIERYRSVVRYVPEWGRWIVWNGERWSPDMQGAIEGMCHQVLRTVSKRVIRQRIFALTSKGGKLAIEDDDRTDDRRYKERKARRQAVESVARLKSANKRDGVLRMARAEPDIAISVDSLDKDKWLLNTKTGIVDLRNGASTDHDSRYLMTKITAKGVSAMQPNRWLRFIDQITDGDRELASYLQRVAGYCLTGETSAQTLFFGFGPGGNGKSVFVNTLAEILADYYRSSDITVFLDLGRDKHPTEIAELQGARFVTASETHEGRTWNESRIKQMTGGDRIAARFMHKDVFTYLPQFKLFIIGNHRPRLAAVNEAIRRRLHLIPFTVTIPPEQRNVHLQEHLMQEEAGGILQWAINGATMYYEMGGVEPPASVISATEEYLSEEDTMSQWLEECCEWDPNARIPARDLFRSWVKWATNANERIGHERDFKRALFERCGPNYLKKGVMRIDGGKAMCYEGILVVAAPAKRESRESA